MWNLVSFRLETVLVSVQDRCTVYAKRNIGTSIVARPKWMLISIHLQTMLILTQDSCMVWAKCNMALETILDAADATPR
jgi:hypothetical protein